MNDGEYIQTYQLTLKELNRTYLKTAQFRICKCRWRICLLHRTL